MSIKKEDLKEKILKLVDENENRRDDFFDDYHFLIEIVIENFKNLKDDFEKLE